MNKFENIPTIESKEKEPLPLTTIYVVRHGDTEYKEELVDPETKNDLTDIGEKQIQNLAEEISVATSEKDKFYIMSSPRIRAENTAEVIKKVIAKNGHEVVQLKGGKNSLRNFNLLDNEKTNIYKKKRGQQDEYLADMKKVFGRLEKEDDYYLKYRAGTVEHSHTQNLEEYKKKIKTFIIRITEIARKRGENNEKLILSTHGEWLDSILEIYFSKQIEKLEDSAEKGESIKIEILPSKLKFYFRREQVVIDM